MMKFPKKPERKKSKLINFYIDEKDHKKLIKKCKENGWTVSGFLRFTVNKYLQD